MVVLPLPRKPVRIVMGVGGGVMMGVYFACICKTIWRCEEVQRMFTICVEQLFAREYKVILLFADAMWGRPLPRAYNTISVLDDFGHAPIFPRHQTRRLEAGTVARRSLT